MSHSLIQRRWDAKNNLHMFAANSEASLVKSKHPKVLQRRSGEKQKGGGGECINDQPKECYTCYATCQSKLFDGAFYPQFKYD